MEDEKKILRKLAKGDGSFYGHAIFCPACQMAHVIDHRWEFNGDMERPTFSPSLLRTGTMPLTDAEADMVLRGEKFEPKPLICHSYIRDGKIQFLSDCSHEMKNMTVDLKQF
jgi:hypothetical protein